MDVLLFIAGVAGLIYGLIARENARKARIARQRYWIERSDRERARRTKK